jgi:hypothetical protein
MGWVDLPAGIVPGAPDYQAQDAHHSQVASHKAYRI